MAEQTAVEWLVENLHLHNDVYFVTKNKRDIIEQAKQMEKEQIMKAWESGNYFAYYFSSINIENGEQYYKETFISTPPTENPSAKESEQF